MVTEADPTIPTIPLARPSLDAAELRACERVLRSGRLVLGPENEVFEAELAKLCGRKHAVCVSSGTTALELGLWALSSAASAGLTLVSPRSEPRPARRTAKGARHEVLVPAAGFPAAVNAILRMGHRPVAVDIDAETWTMDLGAARDAITAATWAIVSVDMLGQVAEVEPLEALARDANLCLVDDAACALGGFDPAGRAGGGYGVLATLSFHPRKIVTTGEGGAVLCDDDALAAMVRELRNQGQSRPGTFDRPGTNARLGEVAAAMGVAQLARLHSMLGERRLLCQGYKERLAPLRDAGKLSWQTAPEHARPACQTFAVLLAPDMDREAVRRHLTMRGIESGVATFSLSRLPAYARNMDMDARRFAVAEALHDRGLALPLFVGMRSAELDRICETLEEALS